MEVLNGILYSANNIVLAVVSVVSLISGIISIFEFFRSKRNKGVKFIIALISVVVLCFSFYGCNLVKVPDVTEYFYDEACKNLADAGLRYTKLIDKDWLVVKEQDPIAGEIVRAGQTVVLTVQSLTEDEFRIQEFYKKYEGEPAADINVSLFEKEIGIISASGEIPLGRKIDSINVDNLELYIYEEINDVKIKQYEISTDEIFVFKNMPVGLKYRLVCLYKGYEVFDEKIEVTTSASIYGSVNRTVNLVPSGENLLSYNSIRIMNEDGKFLDDIECWFAYDDSSMGNGTYHTNKNGTVDAAFKITEDQKLFIKILDPYANGVDYMCELELKSYGIGEAEDAPVVILKKNGVCEVTYESELFYW